MKKNDLLKYLKEIKIDSKMQAALMLLNSRRELDESNIALSFQHRDRIKRVVKEVGLDIDFVSNKLVLESPVGSFEIKNYSNKKKKSKSRDINGGQLYMFSSDDQDIIMENKPLEIGYSFDKKRLKYTSLFLQYTPVDTNVYSVDLIDISSMEIETENTSLDKQNNTEEVESIPKFIKTKTKNNTEIIKVKEQS